MPQKTLKNRYDFQGELETLDNAIVIQGDSILFEIDFYKDNNAYNLDTCTISLNVIKPDSTLISQSTKIIKEGNKAIISVNEQATVVEGTHNYIVNITDSKGNVSSPSRRVFVKGNGGSAIPSKTVVDALDELNKAVATNNLDVMKQDISNSKTDIVALEQKNVAIEKDVVDTRQDLNSIKATTEEITNNANVAKSKCVLSIISDDGAKEEYTVMRQFCADNNIKVGFAIIPEMLNKTNFLTTLQVKSLVAEGHYILGHSLTKYTDLTDTQIKDNIKNCKDLGVEIGQEITQYVYAEGVHDARIRKFMRDNFECAYSTGQEYNQTPIRTVIINRPMYGSYEVAPNNTLQAFKTIIDKAFNRQAWVVLCMHTGATPTQKMTELLDLINYAKGKGIEIVRPDLAYQKFKNVIDIQDETGGGKSFRVAQDGTFANSDVLDSKTIVRQWSGVTMTTPLEDNLFKDGYVTIDNFLSADNSGFPGGAGTLTTYRPALVFDAGCNYQKWIPYSANREYIRKWNSSTKTWGVLERHATRVNKNITLDAVSVAPGTTKDIEVVVPDANLILGSTVIAEPNQTLEAGIIFNVWGYTTNTLILRLSNITGSTLNLASRTWRFHVLN